MPRPIQPLQAYTRYTRLSLQKASAPPLAYPGKAQGLQVPAQNMPFGFLSRNQVVAYIIQDFSRRLDGGLLFA